MTSDPRDKVPGQLVGPEEPKRASRPQPQRQTSELLPDPGLGRESR